jgi:hypothetical protein
MLDCIVTFCTLMLMTSNSYAQSVDYNQFVNETWGFEIQYPTYWEVDTKNYSEGNNRYTNLVTFYSPLENDEDRWRDYVLIGYDKIPYEADLDGYLNEAMDLYKASENFYLVSSSTDAALSGLPAYTVTYTDREGDPPINVKITERATIIDGNAFYIRNTAEENSYSDYFPIFSEMAESFKITETAAITEEDTGESELQSDSAPENSVPSIEGTTKEFQGLSTPYGPGLISYENQFFGIRKLVYPDGWSIIENETSIQLSSPLKAKSVSAPSVYITTYLSDNRTVEDFAADHFRYYSSNLNYTMIEAKPIRLGNQPAHLEILGFVPYGTNAFYKDLTVLIVKEGVLYVVEYLAEDQQYQKYLPTVINMIKSLDLSSTSEVQENENISEPPAILSPL